MSTGIGKDLRSGWRLLTRKPGVAAVAIFSLALGIGANVTIFSLARAVVLRAPDVAQPGQMAEVYTRDNEANAPLNGYLPMSYPDFQDFRTQNQSFSGMTAYALGFATFRPARGGMQSIMLQMVTRGYFSVLGVRPEIGRTFGANETQLGGPLAVVLSDQFWRQQFGGKRDILGKPIDLNGQGYTVVGVAPPGFVGLFAGLQPDFWASAENPGRLGSFGAPTAAHNLTDRNARTYFAAGRLRPGVTLQQASANLALIAQHLDAAYPASDRKVFSAVAVPLETVPMPFRQAASGLMILLMGVVGLVLLIACANAANVLLAQATGRRREMALRAALGASRGRLIRQVLLESIVLALVAGGLGLWIATWAGPLLLRIVPQQLPLGLNVQPDGTAVIFAVVLAIVTGIIFGLAPAWRASRVRLQERLQEGGPRTSAGRSRLRGALAAAEVAICTVVLVSAGLCLRSLGHLNAADPGFDVQHLLVAERVNPGALGYTQARAEAFMQQMVDTARRTPGVTAAAWISWPPLQAGESDAMLNVPGVAPPLGHRGYDIQDTQVSPDFFAAMHTSLLRGRSFTEADLAHAGSVVVVNRAFAEKFWPGQDPIGKQITFLDETSPQAVVIGETPTGKYTALDEAPKPYLYELQKFSTTGFLMMHTAGPPQSVLLTVQQRLRQVDPDLTPLQTGEQFLAVSLFPAHVTVILLSAFGLLALALAVLGLYGVMAYTVSQRRWEFGVRMALGASPGSLAGSVVSRGVRTAAIGVAIGVVLALGASRILSGLLYQVSPTDPVTYAGVALLLVLIAALACYVPARRAGRVDPAVTLRTE